MRCIARLLALLVGVLATWLWTMVLAPVPVAAVPDGGLAPAYAYDTGSPPSVTVAALFERGPPARLERDASHGPGGLRPLGILAHPHSATPNAAYDYDHARQSAQGAGGSPVALQPTGRPPPSQVVAQRLHVAANSAVPAIRAGSEGGESAGRAFSQRVRQEALDENPSTCVYCRMETDRPQVDYVIARSRGGNATLDNAQTTCWWCNASKGARDFPVNPPPGFEGVWPPSWWFLP